MKAVDSKYVTLTIVEVGDHGTSVVDVGGKKYKEVYVPYGDVKVGQQYEALLSGSGSEAHFEQWRRRQ